MFKGAKLLKDLRVTKSYSECSTWILFVMHTAAYNQKRKKEKNPSNFDVNVGLLLA